MLTFSTENTLSLELKSPLGVFACSTTRLLYCSTVLLSPLACSTIYFLLTSPLLRMNARTKQHLLCKTKPISKALLMTVTSALTSTYEEKPPPEPPKNKANSQKGQNEPNRLCSKGLRKKIPLEAPQAKIWKNFQNFSRPPLFTKHCGGLDFIGHSKTHAHHICRGGYML